MGLWAPGAPVTFDKQGGRCHGSKLVLGLEQQAPSGGLKGEGRMATKSTKPVESALCHLETTFKFDVIL